MPWVKRESNCTADRCSRHGFSFSQVEVDLITDVALAERVHLEPITEDDWELLVCSLDYDST